MTCTATDPIDMTFATTSFNVVVKDTTPPTLSAVPANISNVEGNTLGGATVPYTAPTATDIVDGNVPVNCDHASGSVFPVGTTTVTCTATDAHGNSASGQFTVTVVDTTPPTITGVPLNIGPVEGNTLGGASVTYSSPVASDIVDGNVPVNCDHGSGSTFPVGTTTVTCTATDSSGHSATAQFTVDVVDTTKPAFSGVSGTTAEAGAGGPATVSYTLPTASDIVDGSVAVSCNPASGSSFPLGATTVTCTATDAHGNQASTTLTVTVVDTTPPALSNVPTSVTVEANGPSGSHVTYTSPSATDLVDGPVPVLCSPSSGVNFPLGTTTVTCTSTDAHGNRGSVSFAVHVVDTTPPSIAVPAPITVYTTSSAGCALPCYPVINWLNSATASDLVDPSPKITTTGISDEIPIGVNTVDFVATDASGNRATKTSTVTVVYDATGTFTPPTVPPKVTPPSNVSGLSAKVGNGFVLLTWSNPKASDFDHVVVYRSLPTDTGIGTEIYAGSASKFRDTGLQNDTQYRYVVVSFDAAGNRSGGVAILATPTLPKLLAPLDGAIVRRPPVLKWAGVSGADYFNVQMFLDTQTALSSDFATHAVRILSAWPTSTRLVLHKTWRYNGHTYRLKRGIYRWFVWPGYGARSANKYGQLLGQSTFVVR